MEPIDQVKLKNTIKVLHIELSAEQKRIYRRLLERNNISKFDAGTSKLPYRLAAVCTHPFLVPNMEADYYERIIRSAEDPSMNKAETAPRTLQDWWNAPRTRKQTPIQRYDPSTKPTSSSRTGHRATPTASNCPSLPDDVLITIFGFFGSPKFVGPMAIVCKQWKTAAQSDILWQPFCERLKLEKLPGSSHYATFHRQFERLLVSFSSKFEALERIFSSAAQKPIADRQQHIIISTGDTLELILELCELLNLDSKTEYVIFDRSTTTVNPCREACKAFSSKQAFLGFMKISGIETILKNRHLKDTFINCIRRAASQNGQQQAGDAAGKALRVIFVDTGYTRFEYFSELLLQCFSDGGSYNVSFEVMIARCTIEDSLVDRAKAKKPYLFYEEPKEPTFATKPFFNNADIDQLLKTGAYSVFGEQPHQTPGSASSSSFSSAKFGTSTEPQIDINDPDFWLKIMQPKTDNGAAGVTTGTNTGGFGGQTSGTVSSSFAPTKLGTSEPPADTSDSSFGKNLLPPSKDDDDEDEHTAT